MSIKKAGAALVAIILVVLIFLPSILSMNWAKNTLLSSINRDINGTAQIESISLSWFGPQTIHNAKLIGPDGSVIASLHSVTSDTSLLKMILGSRTLGETQVKDLNAELGDSLVKSLGSRYFPLRIKDSHSVKLSDTDLFVSGSASAFKIVASGNTSHQGKQGTFSLNCDVSGSGSAIKANIVDFPVEILDVLASMNNPQHYGIASALLGDTLNIQMNEVSELGSSDISANIQSDLFKIALNGRLTEEGFTLVSPVNTSLSVSPSALEQLMGIEPAEHVLRLTKPVKIDIQLKEIHVPSEFFQEGLNKNTVRNASFDIVLDIPQVAWKSDSQTGSVEKFQVEMSALNGHSSFDLTISGNLQQEGKSFPFIMKSLHQKPLNEEQLLVSIVQPQELSFTLDDLRTKTLDAYFGTGNNWQNTFGKTVSLRIQTSDNDLQTLDASLNSEKISMPNIALRIDQPLRAGSLMQTISGTVKSDAINFQKQKSSLQSLKAQWKADPAHKALNIDFSGRTVFSGSQANGLIEGSLFVDLSREDNPTLKTVLNGKHVPAPLLSLVTGRKEWEPVFGSVIDLNVKAHMRDLSGPVQAEVFGSNGKLEVDGQLTKGVVTLNTPLRLSTHATRELAKEVLSDFAPVFGELLSAESSISLTIDPDQFSMPLSMNFSEIHFKRAVLDLGKMTFRNGGDVRRLLNVLKADESEKVEVWATPLYFSMEAGLLRIYRMDMLVMGRYPIATWGQINLPKDRLDMVLGISPLALAQSLGITGLPKGYMLQVPVKGSSSSTKIDSAKVMSRIGALVAQSSGGPEGLVLGTVLDIANGKEPKIPPPTTNPLPWGELTVDVPAKKSSSNPVNEIRNEATKFIKGIFR